MGGSGGGSERTLYTHARSAAISKNPTAMRRVLGSTESASMITTKLPTAVNQPIFFFLVPLRLKKTKAGVVKK